MKRPFASIGFTYLIALLAAIFAGVNASVVLGISCLLCFLSCCFAEKSTPKRLSALVLTAGIAFFAYFGAYQINVSPVSALDDSDATVSGTVTEKLTDGFIM